MDHQRLIERVDETITERPGRIVVGFLLLTAAFGLGLGNVSTAAGTSQFTTGLPAETALTQVNDDFSPAFTADTGSTQLIQRSQNVLSRAALLEMLRAQKRLDERTSLRVTSTSSAAAVVARQLDPGADSIDEQVEAIESATEGEVAAAVRRAAADSARFDTLVSDDFNRGSASASATVGVVTHEVSAGISEGSGQGGSSPLTPLQTQAASAVEAVEDGSEIQVFGEGVVAQEFTSVIIDSLLLVVPAAVLFIVLFLVVAYRDPLDLLAGVVALAMAVVWTFGFMGLADIPFSQMLIAVPPLLLAVGIDFGIHAVNRYREERVVGRSVGESMRVTTDQLLVAFFIVTGTTVIGFAANLTSALPPIRDFGVVASIGIVFTFLIFGIFLPALKVLVDTTRQRYGVPAVSETPIGSEGSALSGVVVARRAPVLFLVVVLVASGGAGLYATDIATSFSQDDFLPPEENPDWAMGLPEPFRPSVYTVTATTNFLEDNFDSTQSDSVTIYLQGPMKRASTLEAIRRAGTDPPDSFVAEDRQADAESIVTVIRSQAERDPDFRRVVARNDRDGDGIPDRNLGAVYDALLDSPARDQARRYMTEDRRSARVVYTVRSDASQPDIASDARVVAGEHRTTAIATGQIVVFQAVSDLIFASALRSLVLALIGAALFLMVVYQVVEGEWTLGIPNTVPVLVTVACIAGSMRAAGIPFNALTATLLAITIGLGIDYSVHVTHRFVDERRERPLFEALDRTVRGTGGALMGSMFTTVFGIGVLALALFPAIGQFGVLTALSIVYAFLTSVFVLPAALVVWDRFADVGPTAMPDLAPSGVVGTVNPDGDPDPSAED